MLVYSQGAGRGALFRWGKSDKARRDEAGQVGLLVWGVFGNSDMCGRDHQHLFWLNKHSKISPGVCEIRVVRESVAGQGTACEARTYCASFLEKTIEIGYRNWL